MFPAPELPKCSAMTTMMISRMTSVTQRRARCATGHPREQSLHRAGRSKSNLGITWVAVRWYTVSSAASLANSGMTCTAVAPVPITATRRPS